jgi:hypothetical protein
MNELSTTAKQLPDNLEELAKFVLIERARLDAVRKVIKGIDKVELAAEVHEQKLAEAQEIAEAVLDAEAKLGELTSKMEKAANRFSKDSGVLPKKEQLEEIGITEKQKQRYETLARHPETVEKAKADARAEGRIVTRQDVLNRIVPPKTHNRTMREIKRQAREEHKDFREATKDGVVDFQKINKDKSNQEIIALDTNITISKALSSITSIGFLNTEDINLMIKNMKPEAKQDMIGRIRRAGEILDHLAVKIGGR